VTASSESSLCSSSLDDTDAVEEVVEDVVDEFVFGVDVADEDGDDVDIGDEDNGYTLVTATDTGGGSGG
jgi:hypothetical protein